MKIAVFSNYIDQSHLEIYKRLENFFALHNIQLLLKKELLHEIEDNFNYKPKNCCIFSVDTIDSDTDLMLSIGGDGTFLDAVSCVYKHNIPLAGINTGRLGFLADINSESIEDALSSFINGKYHIQERSLLKMMSPNDLFSHFNYAVNELTVHKLDNSSMIKISTSINGEFLANYWADGLIVSTPTGSTAYSLSVGGPIISPELQGVLITPIAPHNLTVRPVVFPDSVEIELNVEGRGSQYLVSIDHRSIPLDFNVPLRMKVDSKKVKVVKLNDQNFYGTLRNKLMWAADRRN